MMRAVDLNCDLGESFGRYKLGFDEEIIPLISSANIACGFHAGDPHVMRRTVALCVKHGVRIGAHPGLPDLLGFGRRKMAITPDEIRDYFTYQIGALRQFVEEAGQKLQHVKAHGALFEMADDALTKAMCEASGNLIWLSQPGGTARKYAAKVAEEFYADRAIHPDKTLVSRQKPGAVIHDSSTIRQRLIQLFETGTVTSIEGQNVAYDFDSICVHGDTAGALDIVRLIRAICAEMNVAVKPLADL